MAINVVAHAFHNTSRVARSGRVCACVKVSLRISGNGARLAIGPMHCTSFKTATKTETHTGRGYHYFFPKKDAVTVKMAHASVTSHHSAFRCCRGGQSSLH
jgi:hypothetical protein